MPTPTNPQSWNRYSYVDNRPLNYSDPTGHLPIIDDDEYGNPIVDTSWRPNNNNDDQHDDIGCSVTSGWFNGSFTCTPDDLNAATIAQRQTWLNDMLYQADPRVVPMFTNINGILAIFTKNGRGAPGTWISWGDAGILVSIQNGLAMSRNLPYIPGSSPYADIADSAWKDFFDAFGDTRKTNRTLQLWGIGEGAGTTYGRWLAHEHGQQKSMGEMLFLGVGDVYRSALTVRQDPSTMNGPQWSADLYGWFLDTSETIPGINIPPVSVVADMLLR